MSIKVDSADKELANLRSNLSRAEAKESKAREEHARHTEDMRGKLERTASEVKLFFIFFSYKRGRLRDAVLLPNMSVCVVFFMVLYSSQQLLVGVS